MRLGGYGRPARDQEVAGLNPWLGRVRVDPASLKKFVNLDKIIH